MAKKWTEEEIRFITDNIDNFSIEQLASKLDRSVASVKDVIYRKLNLKRTTLTKKVKIGNKYGSLTIISMPNRSQHVMCSCACGDKSLVYLYHLINGSVTSCGCHSFILNNRVQGANTIKSFYREYKSNARNRDIQFDLTLQQFIEIIRNNCKYCGAVPSPKSLYLKSNGEQKRNYGNVAIQKSIANINGVDRIDSSKGYSTDNCVACCSDCNEMKMDRTLSEFINKIKSILNHLGET